MVIDESAPERNFREAGFNPLHYSARVRPFAKDTRRSQEEINSPAIGRGAIGDTSGTNEMSPCIAIPLSWYVGFYDPR